MHSIADISTFSDYSQVEVAQMYMKLYLRVRSEWDTFVRNPQKKSEKSHSGELRDHSAEEECEESDIVDWDWKYSQESIPNSNDPTSGAARDEYMKRIRHEQVF